MKFNKRLLLSILLLLTISFFLRGWLYRSIVTYKSIGQRQNYLPKDKKLISYIEINVKSNPTTDVKDIIKIGLSTTAKLLNYSVAPNTNDPNKLIYTQTAHCVGYSACFSTTCNYLFKKYNLDKNWKAKPQIAQLYLFKTNVHQFFDTLFLKDHDIVIIENQKTGELFAVDPTLNDYFYIDFISFERN
ncbi:hypothetical protein Ccan_06890 [Sporocytophaga myxococcoides]|uniref:Uncharacterized protein n=1 Tax=Sporocytophaga myxococcoides TaxID=153721 RepID=A0A098LJK9_9BACT|nr:hypothetical protein [Sporocytophaga myxococcoides]GAL86607.1 hypothetical protein Ccan_06890 [Sporocytophaga myxococcoides]